QIHKVTHIEILLADITTDTGLVGTGFSHTSGVGGRMMMSALEELAPELIGKEVNPRARWHDAWQYLRDNGPGGTTTLAIAAIDIALWDLVAKGYGVSVQKLLGQVRDRIPLYGSGINLNLSAE